MFLLHTQCEAHPSNCVFKRTAEDMLGSSGPLSVSGRLTRR
jgi:hypothetical protein